MDLSPQLLKLVAEELALALTIIFKQLINEQHGFINKLSTITQLINTTTYWANTLNNKGQTDIIFLDFSKAFD